MAPKAADVGQQPAAPSWFVLDTAKRLEFPDERWCLNAKAKGNAFHCSNSTSTSFDPLLGISLAVIRPGSSPISLGRARHDFSRLGHPVFRDLTRFMTPGCRALEPSKQPGTPGAGLRSPLPCSGPPLGRPGGRVIAPGSWVLRPPRSSWSFSRAAWASRRRPSPEVVVAGFGQEGRPRGHARDGSSSAGWYPSASPASCCFVARTGGSRRVTLAPCCSAPL